MALMFTTNNAQGLLNSIKTKIDEGHIVTWEYDNDGDFTHAPEQWRERAFLRPIVLTGKLVFGIIYPNRKTISVEEYAIYHGRFIEMMLAHFDKLFNSVEASALLTQPDQMA
jgi:hypothetical protein